MANRNSTLLTILGVLGIITGVLFSITIIGLIVGIPLFIGSKKFFDYSKLSDEQLLNEDRQALTIWLVVFMVLMFPIGLIALIVLFNLNGELSDKMSGVKSNISDNKSIDNKMAKVKELFEMKEQGIITEEEFNTAKENILKD